MEGLSITPADGVESAAERRGSSCRAGQARAAGADVSGSGHIGDPGVKRASRLAQQSAIGGVLHQGVLKHIGRLRWRTSLVDNFRLD